MKWLTLTALTVGSCLLALAGYVYPWKESVDARPATLKLAQIPTSEVRVEAESVIRFRIPGSEQWRRLIANWGPPTFIAALALRSAKPELACFTETGLTLKITDSAGHAIPTRSSGAAPYGYISQCTTTGLEFVGSPGSELLLHAMRAGTQDEAEGELIIVPYWPYEKDRLVGDMIAADLKRVSLGLGTVGICCLAVSLWLYRRKVTTHVTA